MISHLTLSIIVPHFLYIGLLGYSSYIYNNNLDFNFEGSRLLLHLFKPQMQITHCEHDPLFSDSDRLGILCSSS